MPDKPSKILSGGSLKSKEEHLVDKPEQSQQPALSSNSHLDWSDLKSHNPSEIVNHEQIIPGARIDLPGPSAQQRMYYPSGPSRHRVQGSAGSMADLLDNNLQQYTSPTSFMTSRLHPDIPLDQKAVYNPDLDYASQRAYQRMAPTHYGPTFRSDGSLTSYSGHDCVPSTVGSTMNSAAALPLSRYLCPQEIDANQIYQPSDVYGSSSWGNNGMPVPSRNPLPPSMYNPGCVSKAAQQIDLLQHQSYQPSPVPEVPLLGVGASAAEENRAQRYQTHVCTCGPGCGCLACPIHPYNDATRKEALHVGRLFNQDSPWDYDGDLEQVGSVTEDLGPQPIMYGDEWLEAQHSFRQSELMNQNPVLEHEAEVQGRSCCQSANLRQDIQMAKPH